MTPITQYSWSQMMSDSVTTTIESTTFTLRSYVRRSMKIPVMISINSITEDINQF